MKILLPKSKIKDVFNCFYSLRDDNGKIIGTQIFHRRLQKSIELKNMSISESKFKTDTSYGHYSTYYYRGS